MTDNLPTLGTNRTDKLVAALRGGTGAIPLVGSIIGEIISNVIPNQRVDRIVDFLRILGARLGQFEEGELRERMNEESYVDLLEDGLHQAARALSEERRKQIAALLAHSLSSEDLERIQQKKLMQVLSELNDVEIIILKSHGMREPARGAFLDKHQDIIYGPSVHMGSSQVEVDQAAVHNTYLQHLKRLGLIEARYRRIPRGELPEFDEKTGMIKASHETITSLGRLLLRYIDEDAGERAA